jgi:Chromosome segregation ATPases
VKIVLLTCDKNGALSVQHLQHQLGSDPAPSTSRRVHLLILDARRMDDECYAAACAEVKAIRLRVGINHGILLNPNPSLSSVVAALRCGLRDLVDQYVTASQLRRILRAADPSIRARDLDAAVSFLRTFNGLSAGERDVADLARRKREVDLRGEELAELQQRLEQERSVLERREHDLRERARRLERDFARMQIDADVDPSGPTFAERERLRELEARAAELDRREKLLTEMQTLLLQTPLGEAFLSRR